MKALSQETNNFLDLSSITSTEKQSKKSTLTILFPWYLESSATVTRQCIINTNLETPGHRTNKTFLVQFNCVDS